MFRAIPSPRRPRRFSFLPQSLFSIGLLFALTVPAGADAPPKTVRVEFGTHRIEAEIAADEVSRQRGLMGRTRLAEDAGMLFIFPHEDYHCMWMKNTPLPLAVAFIDAERRVINIAEMQPLSETPHCAAGPARYALELSRGGFARRGVAAGDRMRVTRPLPPPR